MILPIKKQKTFWGICMLDLRRFLFSVRFLGGVLAVCGICLFSMAERINPAAVSWEREIRYRICSELQTAFLFDRYKSLLVMTLAALTVPGIARDFLYHWDRCLLARCSWKQLILSRLTVTVIVSLLAMVLGVSLVVGMLLPIMNVPAEAGTALVASAYQELASGRGAFWYLFLMAANFAWSAVPMCYIGIWISIRQPNAYIGIGAAFLAFYVIYTISLLPPPLFCYSDLSSRPGVGENTVWISTLYQFTYFGVFVYGTGKLCWKEMSRRKENGTL